MRDNVSQVVHYGHHDLKTVSKVLRIGRTGTGHVLFSDDFEKRDVELQRRNQPPSSPPPLLPFKSDKTVAHVKARRVSTAVPCSLIEEIVEAYPDDKSTLAERKPGAWAKSARDTIGLLSLWEPPLPFNILQGLR
ncbi:hypothetical protein CHU98_g12251 [Xylaria longipes]|nr:hypothetical protein CHU98_g12251 [Xylaria longipes]